MPVSDFTVTVGAVAGPLDLILKLVSERKMLVNDISLAAIADSFVAHIERFETLPLEDVAQFLVVAATLLLLKSRSLIPNLPLTQEEEQDIEDLESRLRVYKLIKERARMLGKEWGSNAMHPVAPRPEPIRFSPPGSRPDGSNELTSSSLLNAIAELLKNLPTVLRAPQVAVQKLISMEQMMESIVARLERAISLPFSKLHKGNSQTDVKTARLHVIVSFLAILELAKRGIVALKQNEHFHDIDIETQKFGTPAYV